MTDGPSGLSASEADARLHGAQLDLSTITLEGGKFSIDGWAYGSHAGRGAKFDVRISVLDVGDWRLIDEARIGMLDIHEVTETGTGLKIEGHFPTEIHLTTEGRRVEIEQNQQPFSVRRWFRWKSV
ncbi:hypothetical protein [Pseudolysinimonas sp.]|jgi:hypothetical protein|uniref:hypothetical protein n=1 Tax=Pseudolysinimonas sp. TaxID=2680009 RepID=UPI0037849AE8